MSILIKGMELPKSCPCELLGIGYDLWCSFADGIPNRVKEYYVRCEKGTRPPWCPLIHIPPHGRLIDADALPDRYAEVRDLAPTIIDAEYSPNSERIVQEEEKK